MAVADGVFHELGQPRSRDDIPRIFDKMTAMKNHRRTRKTTPLSVESLEGKALLSGYHPVLHPHVAVTHAVSAPTAVALSGTFQGASYGGGFFANQGYGFTTHGQLATLGTGNLYGGISLPSTSAAGNHVGTLEIVNGASTMTLNITETTSSSSTLPSSFQYKVIVATGRDRNELGQTGAVSIDLMPTDNHFYFAIEKATLTFSA